jgi:hypothetical protein
MRSLWRFMASQWLGGDGSEMLAGDSAPLDSPLIAQAVPAFHIIRDQRACASALVTPSVPSAAEREDIDHAASRPG